MTVDPNVRNQMSIPLILELVLLVVPYPRLVPSQA